MALGAAFLWATAVAAQEVGKPYARDFRMEGCTFANGDAGNMFWNLTPGHWLRLEGYEGLNFVEILITVLPATETVSFTTLRGTPMTVVTRVVEEREWINSELVEVSRNWFARCTQTSNVFYFGEWVDIYQNGDVVSHAGSWRAGQGGAFPGVMMPGSLMPGARYYQEVAPGVALDRAENVAMGFNMTLPYGNLSNCVSIDETTPLEPGDVSRKFYCEGVGIVRDDVAELVARGGPGAADAPRNGGGR